MARRDVSNIQLPEEILALIPREMKPTQEQRDAIGRALEDKKRDAVSARTASGIEDTWTLCEEAYIGIDDANRGEYNGGKWVKGTTLAAPLRKDTGNSGDTTTQSKQSTVFVQLTSRYVDAGAAKVGDILLPLNDKPFSFEPTPVPTLIKGRGDLTPVVINGIPLMRPMRPEEMTAATPYGSVYMPPPPPPPAPPQGAPPQPGAPPQAGAPPQPGAPLASPQQVPVTTKDLAEQAIEQARIAAKKAENRIFDWMVECQHHREMRKVIFDAARLGVGVLKGPIPDMRRQMVVNKQDGKPVLQVHDEIVPIDKWVDVWNIFPDPACGENIRNGDYVFEREYFSEKQLRKLKGLPGYLDDQIDAVIAKGPGVRGQETRNPNDTEIKHQYEVWYYHGSMKKSEFATINAKAVEGNEKDEQVYVIVTFIDGIVIRGAINPLDSGELPYLAVPWSRRPGFWAGVGVAERIFVPQRITNGATRALLNNGGVSAGPQIAINQKSVEPADGDWELTPNKIWYSSDEGIIDDVRKAFTVFEITNVGDQLMRIIEYGMRLAEESTNIPLVTMGQSGKTTPETLGGQQLQDNNANQLLRNIGYTFDDYITEPLVKMYYEYLLLDEKISPEEKGDFKINAHGSVAMVERAIQDQTIAQIGPLAANPIYGANPKKWFAAMLQGKGLDPKSYQYTPEEQAKIDSMPPPEAPAVAVAKIKAQMQQVQIAADEKADLRAQQFDKEITLLELQSDQAIEKLRNRTAELKVKMDTDRDTVFVQAETQRAQAEFTGRMKELELKKELAAMKYANDNQLNVDTVKAKLADTVMKLRTQKELAAMDTNLTAFQHRTPSAKDLMKPPTQKPGKAKAGRAFSQV